jgi:pimeloyl-ACP methyl ester carboxylesterase
MTPPGPDWLGDPVSTDLPLHVTRLGEGEHAFVLLHGYAGSSYLWRNWLPALANRGRVFPIDLKGFGYAPKPSDGRYGPVDLARLVTDFIMERDLRRVTLVGHSLGGGIALLSALQLLDRGEDRVRRMALIGAAAYPQRLPPLVPLSKRPRMASLLMRGLGAERVVRWAMNSIVYDSSAVTKEQISAYARPLASAEGLASAMAVGRQIVPPDLEATARRYGELTMPALMLWGAGDRVIPMWVGERLAADLPQGRLVVLPRCGHVPPEEQPDVGWSAMASFFDDTPESQ